MSKLETAIKTLGEALEYAEQFHVDIWIYPEDARWLIGILSACIPLETHAYAGRVEDPSALLKLAQAIAAEAPINTEENEQ